MKRKLLFLVFLIAGFIIFLVIKFVVFKPAATGTLKIAASPQSSVIINDQAVGRTPFEKDMTVGEYVVKLVPNSQEATASASWSGKTQVNAKSLTYIDQELGKTDPESSGTMLTVKRIGNGQREIEVDTEPFGAVVYLDDEEKGVAPFIMTNVSEGNHEITVRSPGFLPRSQKVRVNSGARIVASFKLSLDSTFKRIDVLDIAKKSASKEAEMQGEFVKIKSTETGWLRVRSEASQYSSESAKVEPGKIFKVQERSIDWVRIEYENGKFGWVSIKYIEQADSQETSPSATLN